MGKRPTVSSPNTPTSQCPSACTLRFWMDAIVQPIKCSTQQGSKGVYKGVKSADELYVELSAWSSMGKELHERC
jgi:hypothetical protein